jgi:hypothetical protein
VADQGGLFGLDPDLITNLGIGLLSAGGKNLAGQGNIGDALAGSMQRYYGQKEAKQKLAENNLQMQMQLAQFGAQMPMLKLIGAKLADKMNSTGTAVPSAMPMGMAPPQPAQAMPPPPQGTASQGMPPAPQGSPAPQAQPDQQNSAPGAGSGLGGLFGNSAGDDMQIGALLSAAGMKGGESVFNYGKEAMQYDPRVATQMAAAKNELTVDQQLIRQAQASNDPIALKAAQMKYLQDAKMVQVGQFNGNLTTFGGITPQQLGYGGFNPQSGIETRNGQASLIPGFGAATQQKSSAEALGKATGEVQMLTDNDPNSPTYGAQFPVPRSVITGGGGSRGPASPLPRVAPGSPAVGGPMAPGASPPSAGRPMASLPPGRSVMIKGNADAALETNKAYQDQAEAGNSMLAQTQTILNAAKDFTPGRFADWKGTALDYLNSSGLITPDQAKALGSKQEGDKIAIQLQAAATKQLGSREAAQIFEKMGKSLPSLTLSSDGLQKVAAWQMGMARYNIARASDANAKAQAQDATGVNQVRDNWIKNSNPLYYVIASAPNPAAREELLANVKDRAAFVAQWKAAAKAGFAPRPSEYSGGN